MLIRILFSIFFPLLTMTLIFTGRARRNSLFLVIGLLAAEVTAYVNGLLDTLPVSFAYGVGNFSPVVEEILKGLPILILAFGWKPTRRDLLEAGLTPGESFGDYLAYAHKLRLAGVPKESALKQTLAFARKKERSPGKSKP